MTISLTQLTTFLQQALALDAVDGPGVQAEFKVIDKEIDAGFAALNGAKTAAQFTAAEKQYGGVFSTLGATATGLGGDFQSDAGVFSAIDRLLYVGSPVIVEGLALTPPVAASTSSSVSSASAVVIDPLPPHPPIPIVPPAQLAFEALNSEFSATGAALEGLGAGLSALGALKSQSGLASAEKTVAGEASTLKTDFSTLAGDATTFVKDLTLPSRPILDPVGPAPLSGVILPAPSPYAALAAAATPLAAEFAALATDYGNLSSLLGGTGTSGGGSSLSAAVAVSGGGSGGPSPLTYDGALASIDTDFLSLDKSLQGLAGPLANLILGSAGGAPPAPIGPVVA